MKKAAVLLSGCGNMDGSEIHESVSVIIALDLSGWQLVFTAPDVPQQRTVAHSTGDSIEPRNALLEAARIARGKIVKLTPELADEVDAVVVPGGLGASLTLCDFALKGSECSANPVVKEFLVRAHSAGKPIAAMCIAPALLARCLPGISITLGIHGEPALQIEKMGCFHVECSAEEAVVDHENRIVTSPAYMTAEGPGEVFKGAIQLVEKLDRMIDSI